MSRRRVVVAALLAGIVAGCVVAVTVPRTSARIDPVQTLAPPRIGAPVTTALIPGQVELRVQPGTVHTSAPVPDPLGGPAWAIRTFLAERVVQEADRRPGVDPVLGHDLCAQLGRIVAGRFGWVDGDDVFHEVGRQQLGAPSHCGSREPDLNGQPFMQAATLIAGTATPDARPLETFAWGVLGRGAQALELELPLRHVTPALLRHGTFLAFGGPELHGGDVRGLATYPGGEQVRLEAPHARGPAGRQTIEARAPDPSGGMSWAIVSAPGPSGGICTSQEARIAGDRAGRVDYGLDLLTDDSFRDCGPAEIANPRSDPLRFDAAHGSGLPALGGDPAPGQAARRTAANNTTIYGRARADVKSITFSAPRDVRTVEPSGRTHAFIVVYDGAFPTGEVTMTTTFTDGRQHSDTVRLGL
jgi:hypothetical protein